MKLTDLECRNAKPGTKPIKLIDGKGLYLLITANGCKSWRLKYRLNQKEQLFTIGRFPQYGLSAARVEVEDARALVKQGLNPTAERKRKRLEKAKAASNTYEFVAREWLEKFHNRGTKYDVQVVTRQENDIFTEIGSMPIADVKPKNVLEAVEKVAKRGANESARRLLQKCSEIFRYAVLKGYVTFDVCRDLKGALPPVETEHHAAITDPDELAGLLKSMESVSGSLVTKLGLELSALLFLRPGALRHAEWPDFELEDARLDVPEERMKPRRSKKKKKTKMKKAKVKKTKTQTKTHIVPLSRQALAILRELKTLTGGGRYILPSVRTSARPMSENTLSAALYRIGYSGEEMTPHGFRATARTILDEVLGVRVDLIEHQLGHRVKDPNGRAYNRTTFLPHREQMMQLWADYLDSLKNGKKFVIDEERYKLCRKHEY
jgi:integrase